MNLSKGEAAERIPVAIPFLPSSLMLSLSKYEGAGPVYPSSLDYARDEGSGCLG